VPDLSLGARFRPCHSVQLNRTRAEDRNWPLAYPQHIDLERKRLEIRHGVRTGLPGGLRRPRFGIVFCRICAVLLRVVMEVARNAVRQRKVNHAGKPEPKPEAE
jgi:hypothetical protein